MNFITEDMITLRNGAGLSQRFAGNIIGRNGGLTKSIDVALPGIAGRIVNGVSITALDGSPLDPATGLPTPTIAIATNAGVTVINDDGTDATSDFTNTCTAVDFFSDGRLVACFIGGGDRLYTYSDYSVDGFSQDASYWVNALAGYKPDYPETLGASSFAFYSKGSVHLGLALIDENLVTPAEGMVALITHEYTTGWMPGEIKGAFLASTDESDLVGGTDQDRSVNNNPLLVTGTLPRAPVAEGAELVGYGPFFGSHYLEQANNTDLDFGTGDFCILAWVNITDDSTQRIIQRRLADNTGTGLSVTIASGGFLEGPGVTGTTSILDTGWAFVAVTRRSTLLELFVDGILDGAVTSTTNYTLPAAVLRVGTNMTGGARVKGEMALLRISATAPTPAQIAKIYADELPLFQPGAACTLAGSDAVVNALAHDADLNLLHVGQSSGTSIFNGLARISETNNAITTCLDVVSGMVAGT